MAIEILMPALSPTMEAGTLTKWLVKEGDTVQSGAVIAEIETDKATMEFEAVDEGVIGKILVADGTEEIKVNTPIAVLLEDSESADSLKTVSKTEGLIEDAKTSALVTPAPKITTPMVEEIPKGTTFQNRTVREAIRDAMAEEMRASDDIFLMGEEVAEYQGAYKVSQGMLEEFGSRRVIDTPITEHGFAGIAIGASFAGVSDCGIHDF